LPPQPQTLMAHCKLVSTLQGGEPPELRGKNKSEMYEGNTEGNFYSSLIYILDNFPRCTNFRNECFRGLRRDTHQTRKSCYRKKSALCNERDLRCSSFCLKEDYSILLENFNNIRVFSSHIKITPTHMSVFRVCRILRGENSCEYFVLQYS